MKRRALVILLLSAFPLAALAGARKPVASFEKLGKDETVVVGRVELVPELSEHEQRLRGPMSGRYRNKMHLMAEARYRELTEEPGIGDFKGRIDATLGEDFFVRSDRKPFYLIAGMMMLELGHGSMPDPAYFPAGFKVDIRPDDRAVYVGTLRYHRNAYFEVTEIELVDDYDRVQAEFVRQFGDDYPLRKALLAPVREPDEIGEDAGADMARRGELAPE